MAIPFIKTNKRINVPNTASAIVQTGVEDTFSQVGKQLGFIKDKYANARNTTELYENQEKATVELNKLYIDSQADDYKNTGAWEAKLKEMGSEFKFSDEATKARFDKAFTAQKTRSLIDITNANIARGHDSSISILNGNTVQNREAYRVAKTDADRQNVLLRQDMMIDDYYAQGLITAVDQQKKKQASKDSFNLEYAMTQVDINPHQAISDIKKFDLQRGDQDKVLSRANNKIKRDKTAEKKLLVRQQEYNARQVFFDMASGDYTAEQIEDMNIVGELNAEDTDLYIDKLTLSKSFLPETNDGVFELMVQKMANDNMDLQETRRMLLKANVRGVKVGKDTGHLSDDDMRTLFSYKVMGREGTASMEAYLNSEKQTSWSKTFNTATNMIFNTNPVQAGFSALGAFRIFQDKVDNNVKEDDVVQMARDAIQEEYMKNSSAYALAGGAPNKTYNARNGIKNINSGKSPATTEYVYKNGKIVNRKGGQDA